MNPQTTAKSLTRSELLDHGHTSGTFSVEDDHMGETTVHDRAPQSMDRQERFDAYVIPELEMLLRVAHTITMVDSEAEKLVEETMVRAYRDIEQFDGVHPRAWLLMIMRDAQVDRSVASSDSAVSLAGQGHPTGRALAALPSKFRRVVELVDLHELSYYETASILGIPEGTVISRLHRGRSNVMVRADAFATPV